MKVFVSSTWHDLQPERQAVERAIHRLQDRFVGMEYFGTSEETTSELSLANVRSSDIYVGIVAHRYGSIDAETGLSITELEYKEAGDNNLERLIYIKCNKVPVPHTEQFLDFDPKRSCKLEDFKTRLGEAHTVTFFTTPDDLAAKVATDLSHRLTAPPEEPSCQAALSRTPSL